MRYGSEVDVLRGAFRIRPKLLEPLGIQHGSRCWAMWYPGSPFEMQPETNRRTRELPHLIVAPLHPDSWPFTYRIEAMIQDQPGALLYLSRKLQELEYNILLSDASPDGYTQANLNAFVEHEQLAAEYKDRLQIKSEFSREERNELFRTIGREMLRDRAALWLQLRSGEEEAYRHFETAQGGGAAPWPDPPEFLPELMQWYFAKRQREVGSLPWFLERDELDDLMICQLAATICWRSPGNLDEDLRKYDDYPLSEPRSDRAIREIARMAPDCVRDTLVSTLRDTKGASDPERVAALRAAITHSASADLFKHLSMFTERTYKPSGGDARLTEEARIFRRIAGVTRELRTAKSTGALEMEQLPQGWQTRFLDFLLHRAWESQWTRPLRVIALTRLAYFRLYSPTQHPMEYAYDAEHSLLRPLDELAFERTLSALTEWKDLGKRVDQVASWGIATFDRAENFVRIKLLDKKPTDDRLMKIEIDYSLCTSREGRKTDENRASSTGKTAPSHSSSQEDQATDKKQAHPSTRLISTRGMLETVCDWIHRRGINLLRMQNKITAREEEIEIGTVSFTARSPIDLDANVCHTYSQGLAARMSEWATVTIRNGVTVRFSDLKVRTKSFPLRQLFVSIPEGLARYNDIERILIDEAESVGLKARFVRVGSTGDPEEKMRITPAVQDVISQSAAMIQIVGLRVSDRIALQTDPNHQPNLNWLHYEYGYGQALGLTPIRVIERGFPLQVLDALKTVNRDDAHIPFTSDMDTVALTECLRRAVTLATRKAIEPRLSPFDTSAKCRES